MIGDAHQPKLKIALDDLFVVLAGTIFGTRVVEVYLRDTPGEPLIAPIFLSIYGVAVLFVALAGVVQRTALYAPLALAMIVWPVLSILWSTAPMHSFERSIGLIGSCALGLFAGLRYERRRFVRMIAASLTLGSFLSAFAVVAMPSVGIDQSGPWAGAMLGVHQHKNALGAASSVACLLCLYAAWSSAGAMRAFFVTGLLVSAVLLFGSLSTTSILVTLFSFALAGYLWVLQRSPKLATLLALVAVLVTPILALTAHAIDLYGMILDTLDKDPTLSNRSDIWAQVWPFIQERFWLGYGYRAFWLPNTPWVELIEHRLYFLPYYSHTAVFELWLDGGVVMVAISLAVLFGASLRAALLAAKARYDFTATFPLVFLATFVIRNVTESFALGANDLVWVLFVALVVGLARDVRLRLVSRSAAAPA